MTINFNDPDYSKEWDLRRSLSIRSIGRDLKLKLIEGYKLNPTRSIDSGKVKFIKRNFKDDILSGSLALSLFFDLDREIKDIDIISQNPEEFGKLYKNSYPEEILFEYVGSKIFITKKLFGLSSETYRVDFFKYDTPYILWNGIKIQDPFKIIEKKIKIISQSQDDTIKEKHSIDLEIIGMKIIHDKKVGSSGRRFEGSRFFIKY